MPELPEVETVRRGLEKYVVGLTLEKVEIVNTGIFEGDAKLVEGAKIIAARRSGKGLILDFSNKFSLAIHIKLTGQLIYRDESLKDTPVSAQKVGTVPNKFTHVIFHFTCHPELFSHSERSEESKRSFVKTQDDKGNRATLYYNDQRRFGWIRVVKASEIMEMPFFKTMGPEPFGLGTGEELTLEKFGKILAGKTTKIKPFIMDQTKIGGIGNIYANDALFDAKINPSRPAKSLSEKEIKQLFDSIIKVLKKSFEVGGASELTFVNILGQEGGYQNHSLVYGKTGKQCPRGDGVIERITLAGRGTFFCKNCQH